MSLRKARAQRLRIARTNPDTGRTMTPLRVILQLTCVERRAHDAAIPLLPRRHARDGRRSVPLSARPDLTHAHRRLRLGLNGARGRARARKRCRTRTSRTIAPTDGIGETDHCRKTDWPSIPPILDKSRLNTRLAPQDERAALPFSQRHGKLPSLSQTNGSSRFGNGRSHLHPRTPEHEFNMLYKLTQCFWEKPL